MAFQIGRAPEREGQEGQFSPGQLKMLGALAAGNALKCFLSLSKGRDRKIFCSLLSRGASFRHFVPEPRKTLGGPVNGHCVLFLDHQGERPTL